MTLNSMMINISTNFVLCLSLWSIPWVLSDKPDLRVQWFSKCTLLLFNLYRPGFLYPSAVIHSQSSFNLKCQFLGVKLSFIFHIFLNTQKKTLNRKYTWRMDQSTHSQSLDNPPTFTELSSGSFLNLFIFTFSFWNYSFQVTACIN
jgi:hypothetical protein